MTKIKHFRNIPNTRSSHSEYVLNHNELIEYSQCYNSIDKFLGTVSFTPNSRYKIALYKYQKEIIDHYQQYRYRIEMFSRQMEMDKLMAGVYLWQMIFNPSYKIIIFGFNRDSVAKYYDDILNLYKGVPYYMQPGLITLSNAKKIEFDNGSCIEFAVYKKNIALGKNYSNYIFIDAAYFLHFESFFKSIYPTISASKDTSITINSTPNGLNYFYDLVTGSELFEGDPLKNSFNCKRAYWFEVPGQNNEEWRLKTIKDLGSEELFNREYNLMFVTSNK